MNIEVSWKHRLIGYSRFTAVGKWFSWNHAQDKWMSLIFLMIIYTAVVYPINLCMHDALECMADVIMVIIFQDYYSLFYILILILYLIFVYLSLYHDLQ